MTKLITIDNAFFDKGQINQGSFPVLFKNIPRIHESSPQINRNERGIRIAQRYIRLFYLKKNTRLFKYVECVSYFQVRSSL